MALRLRHACVTDLLSVYEGELDYIRTWEPAHEAQWHAQMQRHLTRWVDNFERLTIALIDEQFAGYSLWAPEQDSAVLCTLHVARAHRRAGVGRLLLDAYVRDAARNGFTQLSLSVRADNPARWLYESAGFLHTGNGAHDYLLYRLEGICSAQVR